jgi:acyl carrier protein
MRDQATVEAAVRAALESVRREAGETRTPDNGELGLDSTQSLQLIMEIEERLDISIPVETLADARTFDQLCAGIVQIGS